MFLRNYFHNIFLYFKEQPNAEGEHLKPEHNDDISLEKLVDPILELMDKDNDGFITYTEYKLAEAITSQESNNV